MCGIVGYIGSREAATREAATREASAAVVQGLKRLAYRGYDSAGVAVVNDERGHVRILHG